MSAFAAVPASAFSDQRLLLSDVRVLGAILTFCNRDRIAWPSRQRIGERCNITSLSRISKIIGRLESLGWLEVKRRHGSSVYRVLDPHSASQRLLDAPELCTPICTDPCTPTCTPEQTTELHNYNPLPPTPETVTLDDTAVDEPIAIHPDPETVEPSAISVEEDGQEERAAPTEHQDAPKAATSRLERIQAAMRVVERLNQITGLQLPLDAKGTSVRRAARALTTFTESEIVNVIREHAPQFNSPPSLLKRSILEPLIAQHRKRQHQEQQRIKAEQQALAEIKHANRPQGDKSVGRAHLDALKAMLGRSKKPLDEVMRA